MHMTPECVPVATALTALLHKTELYKPHGKGRGSVEDLRSEWVGVAVNELVVKRCGRGWAGRTVSIVDLLFTRR